MGIIVIAEAGVNHNGDVRLACRLAEAAKEAGADYVKFQTFVPEKLVSRFAKKAEYQKKTTDYAASQLQMLKQLALKKEDFAALKKYCADLGIGFLSTPFDEESADFLDMLGLDFWKLPSGEITNLPFLIKIARTGRKVVLSTGMSELDEIVQAVCILRENGARDITILHCTTEYPAPKEEVNLTAMRELADVLKCPVGYSDHTEGMEIPIAAAALGAVVIEKHFTLDRTMEGPDHRASLEPGELAAMVRAIRNVERALGDGHKHRSLSETKNLTAARKSITAACAIRMGEELTDKNLTVKRPGDGISPMRWFEVLGTRAVRNFEKDEQISL